MLLQATVWNQKNPNSSFPAKFLPTFDPFCLALIGQLVMPLSDNFFFACQGTFGLTLLLCCFLAGWFLFHLHVTAPLLLVTLVLAQQQEAQHLSSRLSSSLPSLSQKWATRHFSSSFARRLRAKEPPLGTLAGCSIAPLRFVWRFRR